MVISHAPLPSHTPDQAFLLPASLTEIISPNDAVHVVRRAVTRLDLNPIHESYRAERGRPPFNPEAMVGLLLYGACRGAYSSRRLQAACRENVSFLYLTDRARPDFHTISTFRKRFQEQLKELFTQVLELCRQAGLVRPGPRQPGRHEAARQRIQAQGDELRAPAGQAQFARG